MDRDAQVIAALVDAGPDITFRSIGAHFGVSGERVRQIVRRWEDETGERIPRAVERRRAARPVPVLAQSLGQKLLRRARLEPAVGCWIWDGPVHTTDGGGQHPTMQGLGERYADRLSYRMWRGPIPSKHAVVQDCGNPRCINPYHLSAVSRAEAMRRSPKWDAKHDRWKHRSSPQRSLCLRGHELTLENTVWNTAWVIREGVRVKTRTRLCKVCSRARQKRHQDRKQTHAAA